MFCSSNEKGADLHRKTYIWAGNRKWRSGPKKYDYLLVHIGFRRIIKRRRDLHKFYDRKIRTRLCISTSKWKGWRFGNCSTISYRRSLTWFDLGYHRLKAAFSRSNHGNNGAFKSPVTNRRQSLEHNTMFVFLLIKYISAFEETVETFLFVLVDRKEYVGLCNKPRSWLCVQVWNSTSKFGYVIGVHLQFSRAQFVQYTFWR